MHIPLLARQDIVLRPSRDDLVSKSSLGQMLMILFSSHLTHTKMILETFKITIKDFHLLLSIQWSNPYTNLASILRLTILMIYVVTMFWLSAYFYGSDAQAKWAVAVCVGDTNYQQYDDSKFCSDFAMAFVYSLFACILLFSHHGLY